MERQASQSDEVGARLERIASYSQAHGYQISDDMSQVVASRYAAMAAAADFRDLGAPSLTNTTPSAHQREVRNMIVAKILEDYAANGMQPVEAMLVDPTATTGTVKGPGPVHLSDTPMVPAADSGRPHLAGGHAGAVAGTGAHHAPAEDAARSAIARGAAEVAGEDAAARAKFDKSAGGTSAWEPQARQDTEKR